MSTVQELANELDMTAYGLRAFADGMLGELRDDEEVPAQTEATIREAHEQQAALGAKD